MSQRSVCLLPGDLIGRDLAQPVVDLLAAAGAEVSWRWIEEVVDADGAPLPACLEAIKETGVALRGPFEQPVGEKALNPSVSLRKSLDLYAGIRHVRNLRGIESRYQGVDLVVIRENTEDLYAGIEHRVYPGVVESIKIVTRKASERICHFAYRYALAHGRKRVAIIHKANIMKQTDGLFLQVGQEVAAQYPQIETRTLIVDNAAMQLVQRPEQFDVLVCGNLYGDILSDLAAGLVGGISPVWGQDQGDGCVVFDAIHGHVPEMMGRDVANPLTLLTPAVRLLDYLGQGEVAARLDQAIQAVLVEGTQVTADLGGSASTSAMLSAIQAALR